MELVLCWRELRLLVVDVVGLGCGVEIEFGGMYAFLVNIIEIGFTNKWKEAVAEGSSRWTRGYNKLMLATEVSWLLIIFKCSWVPCVSDLPNQCSP